jgi:bacterial/archaeal transporter family protein
VTSSWQIFAVASAIFAALTAILGKLGVSEINSNFATLIRTSVVLVFTAVLVIYRGDWQSPAGVSRFGITMLVLSGLATGLSWLCFYRALQLGPASSVAPVDKLSVVLVIVFSALFLGEAITLKLALGTALIAAGVLTIIL